MLPCFRYYTSRGKKDPITSTMMDQHKEIARKMGRLSHLYQQNNPALNPIHNGKNTKKSRKNKHKKNRKNKHKKNRKNKHKKNRRKNEHEKKKHSNAKQQEETKDNGRFPPKGRLGSTDEKD